MQLLIIIHFYCFRAQLPARATRLLNRSRIQQTEFIRHGSDSPSSMDSFGRRTMVNSSPGSNSSHTNDDVFLMDRGTKHAMMQDMMYCKSQLNNLRRILQEVSFVFFFIKHETIF